MASQPASKSAESGGNSPSFAETLADRLLLAEARKAVRAVMGGLDSAAAEELAEGVAINVRNAPFEIPDHVIIAGCHLNTCTNEQFHRMRQIVKYSLPSGADYNHVREITAEAETDYPADMAAAYSFIDDYRSKHGVPDKLTEKVAAALVQSALRDIDRLKSPVIMNYLVETDVLAAETAAEMAAEFRKVCPSLTETEPDKWTPGKIGFGTMHLAKKVIMDFAEAKNNSDTNLRLADKAFLKTAVLKREQVFEKFATAVVLAATIKQDEPDFDFEKNFDLPAGPCVIKVNRLVGNLARLFKPVLDQAGDEEELDIVRRLDEIRGAFPDGEYLVSLGYCNISRITYVKGRPDFGEQDPRVVVRQELCSCVWPERQAEAAVDFLRPELPENGRMVVVSKDMFGNDRISAATVLDMVKDGRVMVVAWNAAMKTAIWKLLDARRQAEESAEIRMNANMVDPVSIAGRDPAARPIFRLY